MDLSIKIRNSLILLTSKIFKTAVQDNHENSLNKNIHEFKYLNCFKRKFNVILKVILIYS